MGGVPLLYPIYLPALQTATLRRNVQVSAKKMRKRKEKAHAKAQRAEVAAAKIEKKIKKERKKFKKRAKAQKQNERQQHTEKPVTGDEVYPCKMCNAVFTSAKVIPAL